MSVVIFIFGGVCAFTAEADAIAARLHSIVRTNAIFVGPPLGSSRTRGGRVAEMHTINRAQEKTQGLVESRQRSATVDALQSSEEYSVSTAFWVMKDGIRKEN